MPPPYEDPYRYPHHHHHHHHNRPGIEIDIFPGWRRPYYPPQPPRSEVVIVNPAPTYITPAVVAPAPTYMPGQVQYYNNGAYYNNNPPYPRW